METLSPDAIAVAIGAPHGAGLLGTQDWQSPFHNGVIVSQLHYANGNIVPFRVYKAKNDGTMKIIATRLPSEGVIAGTVAIHTISTFHSTFALR
jgi:hypothetical protein